MTLKAIILGAISVAVLTGCASTPSGVLSARARARMEALEQADISSGAVDAVGQLMVIPPQSLSLEASAMPAHELP